MAQRSLIKRVGRSLLALLIVAASLGVVSPAWAAPRSVTVPILMYHHIDNAPRWSMEVQYYVSPAAFEEQMAYLTQRGYTPVSLEQVAEAVQGGAALPPNPVAITFDDANQDNFDNAFPILVKYHLFATFFIVTGWVGVPGHLTWDDLAVMQQAGMRFGAHTLTHPYLPYLSVPAEWREIADSKVELEAHLGQVVKVFAYPYGRTSPRVTELVQAAGFVAALGTSPARITHTASELFYLTRLGVYSWTTFTYFKASLPALASCPASVPFSLGGPCAPWYPYPL